MSNFLDGFADELTKEATHPLIAGIVRSKTMLGQKLKGMTTRVKKRARYARYQAKRGAGLKKTLKKTSEAQQPEKIPGGVPQAQTMERRRLKPPPPPKLTPPKPAAMPAPSPAEKAVPMAKSASRDKVIQAIITALTAPLRAVEGSAALGRKAIEHPKITAGLAAAGTAGYGAGRYHGRKKHRKTAEAGKPKPVKFDDSPELGRISQSLKKTDSMLKGLGKRIKRQVPKPKVPTIQPPARPPARPVPAPPPGKEAIPLKEAAAGAMVREVLREAQASDKDEDRKDQVPMGVDDPSFGTGLPNLGGKRAPAFTATTKGGRIGNPKENPERFGAGRGLRR